MRIGALTKGAFIGGGFALVLISIFLLGGTPDPRWPRFWMLKPLIIVPLAGAAGGALIQLINRSIHQAGWKKVLANVLGAIAFIIMLWLGTVLGLNGTYWN